MQSTGQTSMHNPQKVQLQGSMAYSTPFEMTAFSGQIRRQLSQLMQMDEISKVTWAIIVL